MYWYAALMFDGKVKRALAFTGYHERDKFVRDCNNAYNIARKQLRNLYVPIYGDFGRMYKLERDVYRKSLPIGDR